MCLHLLWPNVVLSQVFLLAACIYISTAASRVPMFLWLLSDLAGEQNWLKVELSLLYSLGSTLPLAAVSDRRMLFRHSEVTEINHPTGLLLDYGLVVWFYCEYC